MTLEELCSALGETGLPWVRGEWPPGHAPKLPYVVLVPGSDSSAYADQGHWVHARDYTAELYTATPDLTYQTVRAALDSAGAQYAIGEETYIDTESMALTPFYVGGVEE